MLLLSPFGPDVLLVASDFKSELTLELRTLLLILESVSLISGGRVACWSLKYFNF